MKTLTFFIAFCLIAIDGFSQRTTPSRDTGDAKQRDVVATALLKKVTGSLNEKNMNNFGFTSRDDLRNASLGRPYPVYVIHLKNLKEYTNNTSPQSMLTPTKKYIYPIVNSRTGQTINSLEADKVKDKWSVISFGRNNKTLSIAQSAVSPSMIIIVNLVSFKLDFVSYYLNNNLMMIPVVTDQKNNLVSGVPVPAQQVFRAYTKAAKMYNGLPM